MNEEIKRAALESFCNWKKIAREDRSHDYLEALYWPEWPAYLRACEWMHEYATREAAQVCKKEEIRLISGNPTAYEAECAMQARRCYELILANESSGKGHGHISRTDS